MDELINISDKKRFFSFFYSYWIDEKSGKGSLCLNHKMFPKKGYVEAKAIELVSNRYDVPMFRISVLIDNWIEMTEDDYKNWLSK